MLKIIASFVAASLLSFGGGYWQGGVDALRKHNAAVEATNAQLEMQADIYEQDKATLEARLQGALNELQKDIGNNPVCIDSAGVRRLNSIR